MRSALSAGALFFLGLGCLGIAVTLFVTALFPVTHSEYLISFGVLLTTLSILSFGAAYYVHKHPELQPLDPVLYREYMRLRQKSEEQEQQLGRAVSLLERQTTMLDDTAGSTKTLAGNQKELSTMVGRVVDYALSLEGKLKDATAGRHLVETQKEIFKRGLVARWSKHLTDFLESLPADQRDLTEMTCIAVCSIGSESETLSFRDDFVESLQGPFVVQLETWEAGSPHLKTFRNKITIVQPDARNVLGPMVTAALEEAGLVPAQSDGAFVWPSRMINQPVLQPPLHYSGPRIWIVIGQK